MGNGYSYEGNLDIGGISEGTKKKDEHLHHEQTRRSAPILTPTNQNGYFMGLLSFFFVYYISHYPTFFLLSSFPGYY